MERIKISVVIPSYKTEEKVMTRTIESVLSQSYKPHEVIVVDDNGGNEYSVMNRNLSLKYSDSVRFVFYEKNMGANYARNTGVRNAAGEFIAFLDADDEWNNDYLEKNAEIINNKGAKFISNGYYIVTKSGKFTFDRSHFKDGDVSRKIFFKDFGGPTSSIVVNRKTLIDAGLFDESLPARQDYDMWIRCAQLVPFYYINEPMMNIYRDGHDSISSSYERNVRGTMMVLNKILNTYDLSKDEIKNVKYAQYTRMAMSSAQGNNFADSRKNMRKALCEKFTLNGGGLFIVYCFPCIYKYIRRLRHKNRENTSK